MKTLLATDGSKYVHGAASLLARLNLPRADEITVLHDMPIGRYSMKIAVCG